MFVKIYQEHSRHVGYYLLGALANGLALPALWSDDPFYINPPTWSLFYELIASAMFGALAVRTRRSGLIAFATLLCCVFVLVSMYLGTIGFGWRRVDLIAGLIRVGANFSVGCLLYYFTLRKLAQLKPRMWVPVLFVTTFIVLPADSRMSVPYGLATIYIIYPLIIYYGSCSTVSWQGFWEYLGRLSYPLYVLHTSLMTLTRLVAYKLNLSIGMEVSFAGLVITIVIASCILRYFDEPVRSILRAKYGSARHRSPEPA